MKRPRRHPYASPIDKTEAFTSPEEAWFWTMQCMIARHDGARHLAGMALQARPCDPDDVLIVVERLHKQGRVSNKHIDVLHKFGFQQMSPDESSAAEAPAARLWEEALDAMHTPLCQKGIVA